MKKIAFLAALAALFACTKTPQEQPLPTKGNYSGTVSVDWNGGTFDTENISVDYLPAADGMTADIIIYKIKFVPAMPVTIDVTIPGVTVTRKGDEIVLSGNDIIPTAMGGAPYERYKVTGLSGTVSASKLDFSLNFGDSPTRFNGKRRSN